MLMMCWGMSSEEKNRLREVLNGYEDRISNYTNVIALQDAEIKQQAVIIYGLNKQIEVIEKINKREKIKSFSLGTGIGFGFFVILRLILN